ncbi:sodium-coupled monocarboxylate transporter 1-like [Ptychodera flava]|uniref:sodium-coupled monocarboxylate transporter 1-like n=1 Tax=Ptychodera flava TaxID=63121 RepID=UPI00396A1F4F
MSTSSNDPVPFGVADYILFSGMLAISAITAIYQGFAKGGQHSTSRYLLADRKMHFLPVAMSILVSFTSSLSLMGTPAEIFVYGAGISTQLIATLWSLPVVTFIFVPVFHDLALTSAYEYMELRFNFALRITVAMLFMFQSLFYIAACLIGPALAIEAVVDFEFWKTLLITGILGTLYTSLGGMKGVIWTDVFQFFVIVGTLLTVIIIGVSKTGGIEEVFRINDDNGRLNVFSFDLSPTTRLSFLSGVIGAAFSFSPSYLSQTAVQRYLTIRSLKHSQMSLLINVPLLYLTLGTIYLTGLVLFAYYNNDFTPLQMAINVTSPTDVPNFPLSRDSDANYEPNFKTADQILVYFVSSQLGQISGIQGLFVAALFAGALSSVSSSLNALTAVTLEDFIKPFRKWRAQRSGQIVYTNDRYDTAVSKVLTCVYGLIGIGLAFVASRLASLLVLGTAILGVPGAPTLAAYSLGMLYRRANGIGTLIGTVLGFGFGLWISLGAFVNQGSSEEVPAIYRLSFMMYSAYGFAVTLVTGIVVSEIINICFRKGYIKSVDPLLLARCVRPSECEGKGHQMTNDSSTDYGKNESEADSKEL